jgi:ParB-like chromosome segregation protein Spo0J
MEDLEMIHLVDLDAIRPNPWQTRQEKDLAYITELAADIANRYATRPDTCGLLQVPLARLQDYRGVNPRTIKVDQLSRTAQDLIATKGLDEYAFVITREWQIQLVFGHNRLEAFRFLVNGAADNPDWLHDYGIPSYDPACFAKFPVELVVFDDEEMATAAWAENAKRKDISPLDEALAIQRAQRDFGWSNTEISRRWGISPSTISNKLRLLNLPAELQDDLKTGAISERQAMAIIPAIEITQKMTPDRRTLVSEDQSHLFTRAKNGASSDDLRYYANNFITRNTIDLSDAQFTDHPYTDTDGVNASRCTDCSHTTTHQKELRCTDQRCYNLKYVEWKQHRLAAASAATGIPIGAGDISWSEKETFSSAESEKHMAAIFEQQPRCENLILWYDPNYGFHLPDYPDVRVICHHRGEAQDATATATREAATATAEVWEAALHATAIYAQTHCKCLTAARAAATRERNANDPAAIQAKRLQQEIDSITDVATNALAAALTNHDSAAWRFLHYQTMYNDLPDDLSVEQIITKTARSLIKRQYRYIRPDTIGVFKEAISEAFIRFGLSIPWQDASPVAEILTKLERIEGWMTSLADGCPPIERINGNIANLEKLKLAAAELTDLSEDDSAVLQGIENRICLALSALVEVELEQAPETAEAGDAG